VVSEESRHFVSRALVQRLARSAEGNETEDWLGVGDGSRNWPVRRRVSQDSGNPATAMHLAGRRTRFDVTVVRNLYTSLGPATGVHRVVDGEGDGRARASATCRTASCGPTTGWPTSIHAACPGRDRNARPGFDPRRFRNRRARSRSCGRGRATSELLLGQSGQFPDIAPRLNAHTIFTRKHRR
jgi:hypothetical protein